jgi:putative transposase
VVKAASRREAASYLRQTYQVSERRAGRSLSSSNSSLRYRPRRPAAEDLRRRLRELAAERPRYGYQRLWALLRREGRQVNHKRGYRLYVEEGLKLRKRRRRSRAQVERAPLPPPTRADERYSMDFMRDTLADGRVFRTLNIVDDYTRECLAIEVDTSLPGARVVRVLERLAGLGRQPLHIVVVQQQTLAEFAAKCSSYQAAKLSL